MNPTICKVLADIGWFWPAYKTNKCVWKLAMKLQDSSSPEEVLRRELPDLYSPLLLASMKLDRYGSIPRVENFIEPITEAIEATQLGMFHSVVCTLLPVVEGIMRSYQKARGVPVGNGTSWMKEHIDSLAKQQRVFATSHRDKAGNEHDGYLEHAQMLEMFHTFLEKHLLVHTDKYEGGLSLNRHGILHGIFRNYGREVNAYLLFSVLDMLTFTLTFEKEANGISLFAPDANEQALSLASYYTSLRKIGHLRDVRCD